MSSTNESNNYQSETITEKKANGETQVEGKILEPKYPASLRPTGGPSIFLQKRLQKGQKYFDSADYQMAKQNYGKIWQLGDSKVIISTREDIPTPETVRKMPFPPVKQQISDT